MNPPTLWSVLGIVLVLCACQQQRGDSVSETQPNNQAASTDGDLRKLGEELGVSLPAGTRLLWVDRQAGMDELVRAKLVMSKADFDRLAEQPPLKDAALRAGAGRLGTDHGSWDPHATPNLRSGQVQLDGGRFLNLGVADQASGEVTLFVATHGT